FIKFQKLYIKNKIFNLLSKFKYKKSILYSIVNCIIYHINNKSNKLTINSNKLLKLDNIKDLIPIMINLIKEEKKLIPLNLKGNINKSNLIKNYGDSIKYY